VNNLAYKIKHKQIL